MRERRYAMAISLLIGVLFVGSLVGSVAYTRHVQQNADRRQAELRHEQDQRWCPLLATLDQPEVPASTERGRAVQQQIHTLRIESGCTEGR
jgi:hypothetical protein